MNVDEIEPRCKIIVEILSIMKLMNKNEQVNEKKNQIPRLNKNKPS